jgi:hypothetical protein
MGSIGAIGGMGPATFLMVMMRTVEMDKRLKHPIGSPLCPLCLRQPRGNREYERFRGPCCGSQCRH